MALAVGGRCIGKGVRTGLEWCWGVCYKDAGVDSNWYEKGGGRRGEEDRWKSAVAGASVGGGWGGGRWRGRADGGGRGG